MTEALPQHLSCVDLVVTITNGAGRGTLSLLRARNRGYYVGSTRNALRAHYVQYRELSSDRQLEKGDVLLVPDEVFNLPD